MEKEYVKQANAVSVLSLIVNFMLSGFKLIVGLLSGSSALVSDSVHSLSDCFSTIVVIIGVTLSGKKADKDHPYGHERLECIASLVLASILFATAILLGVGAVRCIHAIANGQTVTKTSFFVIALIAGITSVATKFLMFSFTEQKAKELSSSALHGDALHHLSDSLSSIASIVGIVGVYFGVALLDPIASLVICVMIFKAGVDISVMAIDQLVDKSVDEKTQEGMKQTILSVVGVETLDVLRTRLYGNRVFVEVEIGVNSSSTLLIAHRIAEQVHGKIEEKFPQVKHCSVHVNPVLSSGYEPDNRECPGSEW